ncbi:hypothetical protein PVAND_016777 [Polypedilum vanderplanki]|uniref:Uncharacterized protein n=1 Tax=Polypedilum vanderplanki TaxID=319348 RepID=A0A9J6BGZ7_POLVA|nr:hypothetical protein PVAND_016777 [Polypedilum vanderplanki]
MRCQGCIDEICDYDYKNRQKCQDRENCECVCQITKFWDVLTKYGTIAAGLILSGGGAVAILKYGNNLYAIAILFGVPMVTNSIKNIINHVRMSMKSLFNDILQFFKFIYETIGPMVGIMESFDALTGQKIKMTN